MSTRTRAREFYALKVQKYIHLLHVMLSQVSPLGHCLLLSDLKKVRKYTHSQQFWHGHQNLTFDF